MVVPTRMIWDRNGCKRRKSIGVDDIRSGVSASFKGR